MCYPFDDVYQIIVGQYDIRPADYWNMTIRELELIHESKRSKYFGSIHENDYQAMMNRQDELESQGIRVL